ncbi:hypothetical protein D3C71_1618410 [compost metagenome]
MRLHPEVPLVALLRLVHLRVSFAALVLGGTGRRDDRGIHDGASLQKQPLPGQMSVDLLEDVFGQVAGLQQMAEVQDRRLVGNRLQPQPRKRAQRSDLVQGFLHRRIAQRKPVLHQMHTKHRFERIWPASTTCHRVVRLDDFEQCPPGHHQFHLGKEDLPTCLLPLACLLGIRKTDLAHRWRSFSMRDQRSNHPSVDLIRCSLVVVSSHEVRRVGYEC